MNGGSDKFGAFQGYPNIHNIFPLNNGEPVGATNGVSEAYPLVNQLIGLRKEIQENPIFHEKIY